ncbi:hypothetical protein IE81DRAFT_319703 [Ceraceosorus guamensis]|uniref:Secreted protein n=1 Tax=Ceraceosorus guamensis TaxID=1522189 RepID=A0A316W7R7_9BASI|nr:hypothetical protein IE81DRAFT_319703 [Ceraceosorus guamensis]PWN45862.1 hypothetical protein IE81DRAFT_319703 [Ceraceosorus guamensis]
MPSTPTCAQLAFSCCWMLGRCTHCNDCANPKSSSRTLQSDPFGPCIAAVLLGYGSATSASSTLVTRISADLVLLQDIATTHHNSQRSQR